MVGCPWLKAVLVRAGNFTLYHLARLPTHDASNGFRLFSRRAVSEIPIESSQGFCYSIELLVKVHRLGWRIGEVPARWFERAHGSSRFQVLKWLPAICAGTSTPSPRPISDAAARDIALARRRAGCKTPTGSADG